MQTIKNTLVKLKSLKNYEDLPKVAPVVLTESDGLKWISLREEESVAGAGESWELAFIDFKHSVEANLESFSIGLKQA